MSNHEKLWQDLGLDVKLHQELLDSGSRNSQQTVEAQKNRPEAMVYFDQARHESHGERIAELVAARAQGRKVVGTFCVYVPDEIALAVDMIPVALCGGTNFTVPYAEGKFPRDICPLIKSTLGMAFAKICPYGPILDMMVGETTCDAKKKTWEILADSTFHVMEVPQKKQESDLRLWREEVQRFRDKVEEISGRKVKSQELAGSIRIVNEKRRALQKLAELRKADRPPISGLDALAVTQLALSDDPVRFTAAVNRLNAELATRVARGISPFAAGTKRILFSGCPAVMGNWKVHALIESSGAAIVHDETCTGSRYFDNLVDETAKDLDGQIAAIADRYFKVNCACFTPNQERIDGIVAKAKEYGVHGVVEYVLQTCHGYNIEAIRVETALKEAGIPSLKVVTDYSEEDAGQLRTRIEAFLERLG